MAQTSLEGCIRENVSWYDLPADIKSLLSNSEVEYKEHIRLISFSNQLRWENNLVSEVERSPEDYYRFLLAHSVQKLLLFPYHLSRQIIDGLRVTPFKYYHRMLRNLISDGKNYDTLPNFTAADVLRLTGIGRNQFIDIVNSFRGGKSFLGRLRLSSGNTLDNLLPAEPLPINIQAWWHVNVCFKQEDEVKDLSLTPDERQIFDDLVTKRQLGETSVHIGTIPYETALSLYRKQIIYLDVPIADSDVIMVEIDSFIMNRTTNDPFEKLLYNIFVSLDGYTTIEQLSKTLIIPIDSIKNATSLYLRLGFAKKKKCLLTSAVKTYHTSWNARSQENDDEDDDDDGFAADSANGKEISEITKATEALFGSSDQRNFGLAANEKPTSEQDANEPFEKRVALLFDSSLTAYLMMGNLSAGLKNHAVTLFEVGRLTDESMAAFLGQLENVNEFISDEEDEASRFFSHAICLKEVLKHLKRHHQKIDMLRCESLKSLDSEQLKNVLHRNYRLLVAITPLASDALPTALSDSPPLLGPWLPQINSVWFILFIFHLVKAGPTSLLLPRGTRIICLPRLLDAFAKFRVVSWDHEPVTVTWTNILSTLNETLTHSPVLVQALRSNTSQHCYIPLPLESSTDFVSPAIKKLAEVLPLNLAPGYITLSRNCEASSGSSASTDSQLVSFDCVGSEEWQILDLNFGLPLFSSSLQKRICERMESADSLTRWTDQTSGVTSQLLNFIAQCGGSDSGNLERVPWPTTPLIFDEGIISRLNLDMTDYKDKVKVALTTLNQSVEEKT